MAKYRNRIEYPIVIICTFIIVIIGFSSLFQTEYNADKNDNNPNQQLPENSTIPDDTPNNNTNNSSNNNTERPTPNSSSNNWPQFHNDARHSGYTNVTISDELKLLWSVTIPPNGNKTLEIGAPIVFNNNIFFFADGWLSDISRPVIPPLFQHRLYAINGENGSILWYQEERVYGYHPYNYPPIAFNNLVVGGMEMDIRAINITNGNESWSFSQDYNLNFMTYLTYVNEHFYTATLDYNRNNKNSEEKLLNYVYKINNNGTKEWNTTIYSSWFSSSPIIHDGRIYYVTGDGIIFILEENSGQLIKIIYTDYRIGTSPTIQDRMLYLCTYNGTVIAIDTISDELVWLYKSKNYHPIFGNNLHPFINLLNSSSPAIAHDIIFVGLSDGQLHAIDSRDGTEIWSYSTQGFINSPTIAGDNVIFGSTDGNLHIINAFNGSEIWNYSFGSHEVFYINNTNNISHYLPLFISSPAVANNTIYVGANGSLYAFFSPENDKPIQNNIGDINTLNVLSDSVFDNIININQTSFIQLLLIIILYQRRRFYH